MGEELLHFPTTDHLSLSCRNELSHRLAKASFDKTAVLTATHLHRCHVQWFKQDSHQVFQYCWEVPCPSVSLRISLLKGLRDLCSRRPWNHQGTLGAWLLWLTYSTQSWREPGACLNVERYTNHPQTLPLPL